MSKGKKVLLIVACILLITCGVVYRLAMPGTVFLTRFMDKSEGAGKHFEIRKIEIDDAGRVIPAKVFEPNGGGDSVALLLHGVHYGGYNEPRLMHFSKVLAGLGWTVITPDIEALRTYEISESAVSDILRSAIWTMDESGLMDGSGRDKLGLFGISFAGGLALSAAAQPELKDRVSFVFSFGGHADLKRTMLYLVTGDLPGGGKLPPHVYGQAVLVRQFAKHLVPRDEVDPLRNLLLDYLKGEFEKVRAEKDKLGPSSQRLVELCLKRDTEDLGEILEPVVAKHTPKKILSPVLGPTPLCPVFLLHGSVDNVIPPSETIALEEWASKHTETTALVSELIKHVELEDDEEEAGSLLDYLEIVRFWTELLRS